MDDLKRKTDLARALFGARSQAADRGVRRTQAVAASASESGSVAVEIDGQTIEVPTTGQVAEGEAVVLDVEQGGTVVAHGSVGWGDRLVTEIGETYATYSSVEQTASEIRAEVGETYQSKADAAPTDGASGAMPLTVPAGAAALTLQRVDGPAQPVSALGFFEHPGPPDGAISDDVWSRFAANPSGTARNPNATVEVLEDGWLHVDKQAAGSNLIFAPRALAEITKDGTYTVLFEFRNVTVGGTDRMQIAASSYGQLYAVGVYFFEASAGEHRVAFPSARTAIRTDHSDLMRFNFSSLMSCSLDVRVSLYRGDYAGGWVPENSIALITGTEAVHVGMAGNALAEGDALTVDSLGAAEIVRADSSRVPLGTVDVPALTGAAVEWRALTHPETTGAVRWLTAYGSELAEVYATNASLSVQADRITAEVEARTGETAALSTRVTQTESDVSTVITDVDGLQTIIRETSSGVLVCRSGDAIGAMIWASGGFDVVNVTWADGVPTVGESITYMGAEKVRVGKVTEPHVEIGSKVIAASDGVNTIMSASLLTTDEYDWSGDSELLQNNEIMVGYGCHVPENGWELVGMAVVGDQLQPLPNGAEFSCTDPYYVPVLGSVGYYAVNWSLSNQTGSDLYYTVIQAVKSGFRYGSGFTITPTGDVACESIEAGGVDVTSELSALDSRADALEAARQSGTLDNTFKNLTIENNATHIVTLTSGSGTLVYTAAAYAGNIVLTQVAGTPTSAWRAVSSGLTLGLYSTDRVSTWAVARIS